MITSILNKHVSLSMINGGFLEGFVKEIDEQYAELIERDNSSVIVKLEDISFARVGVSNIVEKAAPATYNQLEHQNVDEGSFSMNLPNVSQKGGLGVYKAPTFTRKTERNDIE